jgi:hypothetical protein
MLVYLRGGGAAAVAAGMNVRREMIKSQSARIFTGNLGF